LKSNVDLVRQGMESWSRGDFETTLSLIDPDVIWRPIQAWPGIQPEYRGHAGVRRFWDAFREPWETITMRADEIRELDALRVLTRSHFRARGRASGVTTEAVLFTVWTLQDGKLVRFEGFTEEQVALEAAERAEPVEDRPHDRLRAH
jgi:ketosteroid isomerase-like protein